MKSTHEYSRTKKEKMASPCTSCLCVYLMHVANRLSSLLQQGMQRSHRLTPIANSCHNHHSHQLFTGALPLCLPLRLATKARVHGRVVSNSSISEQTSIRFKSCCRKKSRKLLDACHVTCEQEMLLCWKSTSEMTWNNQLTKLLWFIVNGMHQLRILFWGQKIVHFRGTWH